MLDTEVSDLIRTNGMAIYGLGRIGRQLYKQCIAKFPDTDIKLWDENAEMLKSIEGLKNCELPDWDYSNKKTVVIVCLFSKKNALAIEDKLRTAGFINVFNFEHLTSCNGRKRFDRYECNRCVLLNGGCEEYGKFLRGEAVQALPIEVLTACPTFKCTLKCKGCVQYTHRFCHDERGVADSEKFLLCLEKLIEAIGFLKMITLVGGELFAYPKWKRIVQACIDNSRIGIVNITTNGIYKLTDDDMHLLQDKKVIITLDDYGREKVPETLYKMFENTKNNYDAFHVNYLMLDNSVGTWYQLGDFKLRGETANQLEKKYTNCYLNACYYMHPNYTFSICGRQNIGELLGEFIFDNQEIISLEGISSDELRLQIRHLLELKFLEVCNYCNGNAIQIDAGVQLK
jgi:hypothetical protein